MRAVPQEVPPYQSGSASLHSLLIEKAPKLDSSIVARYAIQRSSASAQKEHECNADRKRSVTIITCGAKIVDERSGDRGHTRERNQAHTKNIPAATATRR